MTLLGLLAPGVGMGGGGSSSTPTPTLPGLFSASQRQGNAASTSMGGTFTAEPADGEWSA